MKDTLTVEDILGTNKKGGGVIMGLDVDLNRLTADLILTILITIAITPIAIWVTNSTINIIERVYSNA